ncbi:MAG: tRNA-guanine transglycosylase, partial [Verrucomicrobiota bacterium]|nr:tRNA-guanine transglycosylase [Verrucomicrobiota bacterium]
GESPEAMYPMVDVCCRALPPDQPRYLMGVGTPLDILEAVHRGVDMFDCIIPTQVAQRGGSFTSRGYLQLRRGVYKFSDEPLDPECSCPACARYSRAYLHHLTKTGETLGWQLIGKHNFHFYHQLMREIRESILANSFAELYRTKREFLHAVDPDNPVRVQKPKKARPTRLGAYEVHIAREGFASIRHVASGEIMHSRTDPMEEARRLYVEQARLAERLRESTEPLVIWDVGLGAAANAMAAIRCYENAAPTRELRIVSFENDLDSLKLAFKRNDLFTYLRHGAPAGILAHGRWSAGGINWSLVVGDFPASISAALEPPDLIFYDMFSSNTCPEQWTRETFERLFAVCRGREVELFTYTCSTAARVALLAAGFYVARGRNAGEKEETTVAFTAEAAHRHAELLAGDWLERWHRSGAKFPRDLQPGEHGAFEKLILGHKQFQRAEHATIR